MAAYRNRAVAGIELDGALQLRGTTVVLLRTREYGPPVCPKSSIVRALAGAENFISRKNQGIPPTFAGEPKNINQFIINDLSLAEGEELKSNILWQKFEGLRATTLAALGCRRAWNMGSRLVGTHVIKHRESALGYDVL